MPMKRATMALSVLAAGFVVSAVHAQAPNAGAGAGSPNILFIISDDIGVDVATDMYPGLIDDLVARYGPAGHDHPDYAAIDGSPASTPVLADLARQGMRFTNVWAHPFCSPTRAAIITGLFAAETRVTTYQDPLAQSHTTFVRKLKDEGGYSTAIFGKWHLAGLAGGGRGRGGAAGRGAAAGPGAAAGGGYSGMKPKEAGFDLFRGNLSAAIGTFWSYDYQVQEAGTPAGEWRSEAPPERSLPGIAPTTYAPVVKVADTIEWITAREAEDADKPWFAWLAFNLSHATAQRAPSQMAVPNADTLGPVSRREMEACGATFGTQETGSCSGESLMRAMTSSLDTILGLLLEAVGELDPNTYIVYIGDNGTPMYGRPDLDFIDNMYITRSGRGKGTVYESGARVALTISGPGIEANGESGAYAHAVDLYSTILSLAGLDAPERVSNSDGSREIPLDARSLAPILFDGATAVRDPDTGYILTETNDLMRGGVREVGARNARYKVLCTDGAAIGQCSFYDLGDDPLEEYPLAIPESCDGSATTGLTPADAAWHYCRLTEVVAIASFL